MKKITFIAALFVLLAFSTCVLKKNCPTVTEVKTITKTDIVWQDKPVIKYDTIYFAIPGPTVVIPSPCDKLCDGNGKLKPFYRETKKNGIDQKLFTDLQNNTLVMSSNADSLTKVNTEITIRLNHLIKENTSLKKTVIGKEDCTREHRGKIDHIALTWLWICIGALICYLFVKFGPKILRLLKFIP